MLARLACCGRMHILLTPALLSWQAVTGQQGAWRQGGGEHWCAACCWHQLLPPARLSAWRPQAKQCWGGHRIKSCHGQARLRSRQGGGHLLLRARPAVSTLPALMVHACPSSHCSPLPPHPSPPTPAPTVLLHPFPFRFPAPRPSVHTCSMVPERSPDLPLLALSTFAFRPVRVQ